MFSKLIADYPWIIPILFLAAGLAAGIVAEVAVLRRLRSLAARTAWDVDDILAESLRRMPLIWFTLAGVYGAVHASSLSSAAEGNADKAIVVLAILTVTIVLARMAKGFMNSYGKRAEGAFFANTIFTNITRIVVFIIGFLVILQTLGISITPILTALGVGGLAVALALQDTLSNLFAGIQVIASRQIGQGDYIRLGSGEEGFVTDINWRYTTIRALANNLIIVPNSKIASAIVTNYDHPQKEMSVLVEVGVSYDSDLEIVERVTIETAARVLAEAQGGVAAFEPFIRYHTFNDFSIDFTVILRVGEFVDQYFVKHEFVKRLKRAYDEHGIEIPFPIRTVYMESAA
ncbi:MAG TPA: mechanosensitive ion channel family protein [Syntrophales bacterium]|nr:mechanosensitive ion channel family protein [Syntrophales bacterium]